MRNLRNRFRDLSKKLGAFFGPIEIEMEEMSAPVAEAAEVEQNPADIENPNLWLAKELLSSLFDTIYSVGRSVVNFVVDGVRSIGRVAANFATTVRDTVADAVATVSQSVSSAVSTVRSTVANTAANISNTISSAVSSAWSWITGKTAQEQLLSQLDEAVASIPRNNAVGNLPAMREIYGENGRSYQQAYEHRKRELTIFVKGEREARDCGESELTAAERAMVVGTKNGECPLFMSRRATKKALGENGIATKSSKREAKKRRALRRLTNNR